MNLTTIYNAARKLAAERDDAYKRMSANGHKDAARLHNIWNHAINSLIDDYKSNGGKRDIEKFKVNDK